jgi:hypothetical protein
MSDQWMIPESCRTLPGENSVDRLGVAWQMISLLQGRIDSAPKVDSRTEWTKWIKEGLFSLTSKEDFCFSPKEAGSTEGEFMRLDFCCEEKVYPKRIILAAESELDDSKVRGERVEQDFEKLLAVKSPFKLMVYSSAREGCTNLAIVEKLELNIQNYGHHLMGETYIFMDYNEHSGKNGSFIAHTWQLCKSVAQAKLDQYLT